MTLSLCLCKCVQCAREACFMDTGRHLFSNCIWHHSIPRDAPPYLSHFEKHCIVYLLPRVVTCYLQLSPGRHAIRKEAIGSDISQVHLAMEGSFVFCTLVGPPCLIGTHTDFHQEENGSAKLQRMPSTCTLDDSS